MKDASPDNLMRGIEDRRWVLEKKSLINLSAFLKAALKEDLGRGDITTDSLISKKQMGKGVFLAKQDLVLSGLFLAPKVFSSLNKSIKVKFHYQDGDFIPKGKVFGQVTGPAYAPLEEEQSLIYFNGAGISAFNPIDINKIKGHKTKILDTRRPARGITD
ncbi:MAG: hypothetical protein R2877_04195 [Bdellovibrionota bacterium]